jgi:lysophospholipase L1-like esterase
LLASPAAAARPAHFDPPKRYYLALGDSIGYGFQTSKALAGLPPQAFNTGYVDLLSARLRHLQPGITTVNFSCPGESTLSFTTPCAWKASGHALHDDYPGSQLDAALAFLTAHRGRVSPVTLSLNGNDITAFLQSCPPGDLACIQDGAPAAIAGYRTRLTAILERLRAAAPDAEITDPDKRSQESRIRRIAEFLHAGSTWRKDLLDHRPARKVRTYPYTATTH